MAEYMRRIDFDVLDASPGRYTSELVGPQSGLRSLFMTVIKTPPGLGSPAGLHTHVVDQTFYVLRGTLRIEIAGIHAEATEGSVVIIPAGVPHRNWNDGAGPAVHLAIASPAPDPAESFARPA